MDNTEEVFAWTPPSPDCLSGEFPNLEIQSLLAVGGMSAVYLVRQLSLDRLAVLKILPLQGEANPEASARFQTEARALASVRDSGVVEVYDFGGTSGGYLYLLLEYEAGGDLRGWMRNRAAAVTPGEALEIGIAVSGGLAAAHRKGIIHGDIKPDNIFLDDRGRLKLGDFGLAGSSGTSTATHHTPGYTAPEILAGYRLATPQSDLYAVGATLFEVLLGSPPSEDPGSREAALAHLPKPVAEVIGWVLKEDPAERPVTAEDFWTALRTARAQLEETGGRKNGAAAHAPVVILQPSASRGKIREKRATGKGGNSVSPALVAGVTAVLIGGGYLFSKSVPPPVKPASPPPHPVSAGAPPPSIAYVAPDKSSRLPEAAGGVAGNAPTAAPATTVSVPESSAPASAAPTPAPTVQAAASGEPNGLFGSNSPSGTAPTSGIQSVVNDLNGNPNGGSHQDDAWLEEGTASTDLASTDPAGHQSKKPAAAATDEEIAAWNPDWKINAPHGADLDAACFSTSRDGDNKVLILVPFSGTKPATLTRQMQLPGDRLMQLSVRVRSRAESAADWVLKAFADDQPLSLPSVIASGRDDRQFQQLTWDLSNWKGRKVTLRLENCAGGGDSWNWEHSYWSWIKVEPLNEILAHAKYNAADASKGPPESGFVDLFSAANAPVWRGTETGGLSFQDGVATVYTKPGAASKGLIWFPKRMFRDFVLRVDFKMDTPGVDSGVWLRIPEPGKEKDAGRGAGGSPMEVEIKGYQVSSNGTGSIAGKSTPSSLPLKQNDWNRYEITVAGIRCQVKLNGVVINEYMGGSGEPGYLALQHVRTDGAVHYRNLWIRELSTAAAAQPVSLQPAAGPAGGNARPLGVPGDAREFNGKWYRYYPGKLLWRMAKKRCEDLRGRLAKVPDAATNEFLAGLIGKDQAWLGATDEKNEGQWYWLDGTPLDYANWASGQPDNRRDREDFLSFWYEGKWNDSPNDYGDIRGFICEWN